MIFIITRSPHFCISIFRIDIIAITECMHSDLSNSFVFVLLNLLGGNVFIINLCQCFPHYWGRIIYRITKTGSKLWWYFCIKKWRNLNINKTGCLSFYSFIYPPMYLLFKIISVYIITSITMWLMKIDFFYSFVLVWHHFHHHQCILFWHLFLYIYHKTYFHDVKSKEVLICEG